MAAELQPLSVLAAYSDDCRPSRVEWLGSAGGFSGARFWRLQSRKGPLCLRCWPQEHPAADGLEFIQAVLWHVVHEGFDQVPLPLSTRQNKGYVSHGGHFWELAPWMPGEADFTEQPTDAKLHAAMVALAQFHRAAETFPLPHPPGSPSPGIRDRVRQLQTWISGDLERLVDAIAPGLWPDFEDRAAAILQLVPQAAGKVLALLHASVDHRVSLQPCIRDVWHDHVLFQRGEVSGLIDFGSMAAENVAADVA
ncbi:MAG: phosphotransferase [Planctomycetes bacterium]|nr:phosphotransferase [Planctomycetota bacterium]